MTDVLIGTAGHIDHGKTTLVGALTGINTDRLKEEQARGITIDIGFAHCDLDGFRVGFIDVPGHERFVKNMLAGIGGIQVAMLVVAADESIMPQTREHFEICRLLNLRQGLIILTKKSLVEEELLSLVAEEVAELVQGSFLESAPVVAVDSVTGDGLDELRGELARLLHQLSDQGKLQPPSSQIFRLPIDRVFSIRGFGTVVTGTPVGGSLQRDAPVTTYPGGEAGKVRGVEIFGEAAARTEAGQRTALNLSGLERGQLQRGMVLSSESDLTPTHMFDVRLRLIEEAAALKHRAPIRLHQGTAEAVGRVYLLDAQQLAPGGIALAQLRLDQPLIAFPGERFVLRRYSPSETIGGGMILDNRPAKHRSRELGELLPRLYEIGAELEATSPSHDALVEMLVGRESVKGLTLRQLVAATALRPEVLRQLVEGSEKFLVLDQDPILVFGSSVIEQVRRSVLEFLEQFHDSNPLAVGASQQELKKRLLRHAPPILFQEVLQHLEQNNEIEVQSGVVALRGRTPSLSASDQVVRTAILDGMARRPLAPPSLEQLLGSLEHPAERVRSIYYFLLQAGELVRITDSYVLLPDQLHQLTDQIVLEFPKGTSFTVAQFKDVFQVSRKYAIPLLEHLDRQRVTRRQGDQRVVL